MGGRGQGTHHPPRRRVGLWGPPSAEAGRSVAARTHRYESELAEEASCEELRDDAPVDLGAALGADHDACPEMRFSMIVARSDHVGRANAMMRRLTGGPLLLRGSAAAGRTVPSVQFGFCAPMDDEIPASGAKDACTEEPEASVKMLLAQGVCDHHHKVPVAPCRRTQKDNKCCGGLRAHARTSRD